jgi:hypothetical protein
VAARLEQALKGNVEDLKVALIEARELFDEARSKNPMYKATTGYSEAQKEALEAARKRRSGGL